MDRNRPLDRRHRVLLLARAGPGTGLERRDDGGEAIPFGRLGHGARVVAGRESLLPGQGPDLQEVHGGGGGFVLLRVRDAAPARGELHVAPPHAVEVIRPPPLPIVIVTVRCVCVHRVPVCELAREDVGEDFGVAVRVRREAGAGRHAVFVEHAQGAELLELRGVVLREGEGVVAVEPAVVGVPPSGGAAGGYFHVCGGAGGGGDGLGRYYFRGCFGGDGHVEFCSLVWEVGLVWDK